MVVVSAGFHKTHVTTAAREALNRRLLTAAITGAYPTPWVERAAARLRVAPGRLGRLGRLLERGEGIPSDRLVVLAAPELLGEAARVVRPLPGGDEHYARAVAGTWRLYGHRAARELDRLRLHADEPRIFHFRAGFGHASITRARALGMHVLCDHAIAHPAVLGELVEQRGDLALLTPSERHPPRLAPTEQAILEDIDRSDSVLVNSDFVKQTFLARRWPEDRIHVVYLGVDENFLRAVPDAPAPARADRLRLLFAGRFERRKGAEDLCDALQGIGGELAWELVIAGPVLPEVAARCARLLDDRRVRVLGTISRQRVAVEMAAAPVFVFPSYAEGSARAVFEALACGCYVITTANSGTIVADGVHGALVPPGDPDALRQAIARAAADPERVREIGARNATLIRERYTQRHYGDELASLYRRLVTPSAAGQEHASDAGGGIAAQAG